ncbi:cadherin domain-containing protein [Sphingomonas sp. ID1715]|uniref:PQQ-dependent sugar dehydrogenase n=1 Tax=Sphingomonas sp. ID1715 TaxID=1656898 RepID=UPI0014893F0D|nr:PQQ-dependent sugar dehydrogenase [Sphingomonas sp. ID1715]NNM78095.1 cadherin domain-containing protein [Sphingomonas sp. ID1715]
MVRRACSMLVLASLLGSCGGDGGGPAPSPTPTPTNAPPTFTSAATANVTTGASGTIYMAQASDPNNDPLTYSISGGADQALFQVSGAGALSFRTPPDVGTPTDQDRNNVYLVQLRVSDGQAAATLDLALTVVPTASGFRVRRVATGFNQPVFLTQVPNSDRVFVVERGGVIRILDPATGTTAATPFLDVSAQISTDGERGLLGLATADDYPASGTFYVFLTNQQGSIEVRRYRRSAGNPDLADASTADVILTIPHPGFSNHYGGWIGLGPDGLLYIATGDGGGGGDPNDNAQNRNSLLGKILRIDPRGDDFPADPNRDYAIPAANPFAGGGGAREVFAYGLRNPFRASFDNGALLIGDVGQNAVEEVDILPVDAGAATNFGWPILEGTRAFRAGSAAGLTPPVTEYTHGSGPLNGNTVTGGVVYRGPIASLQGSYIFADFINPRLWSVPRSMLVAGQTLPSTSFVDRLQSFAPNAGTYTNIVSFGTDRRSNLYIVDFDGEIFVLEPTP